MHDLAMKTFDIATNLGLFLLSSFFLIIVILLGFYISYHIVGYFLYSMGYFPSFCLEWHSEGCDCIECVNTRRKIEEKKIKNKLYKEYLNNNS